MSLNKLANGLAKVAKEVHAFSMTEEDIQAVKQLDLKEPNICLNCDGDGYFISPKGQTKTCKHCDGTGIVKDSGDDDETT